MKIDVLREACQAVEQLGAWPHLERRTEMKLADADALGGQRAKRVGGFLELDREVAGVVVDAQSLGQAIIAGPLVAELAIKPDHLVARLKVAQRLWLESKVEILAALFAERVDVLDDLP